LQLEKKFAKKEHLLHLFGLNVQLPSTDLSLVQSEGDVQLKRHYACLDNFIYRMIIELIELRIVVTYVCNVIKRSVFGINKEAALKLIGENVDQC